LDVPYQCPVCRRIFDINIACTNCNYSSGLDSVELIGGATMDQWEKKMAFEEEQMQRITALMKEIDLEEKSKE